MIDSIETTAEIFLFVVLLTVTVMQNVFVLTFTKNNLKVNPVIVERQNFRNKISPPSLN